MISRSETRLGCPCRQLCSTCVVAILDRERRRPSPANVAVCDWSPPILAGGGSASISSLQQPRVVADGFREAREASLPRRRRDAPVAHPYRTDDIADPGRDVVWAPLRLVLSRFRCTFSFALPLGAFRSIAQETTPRTHRVWQFFAGCGRDSHRSNLRTV